MNKEQKENTIDYYLFWMTLIIILLAGVAIGFIWVLAHPSSTVAPKPFNSAEAQAYCKSLGYSGGWVIYTILQGGGYNFTCGYQTDIDGNVQTP